MKLASGITFLLQYSFPADDGREVSRIAGVFSTSDLAIEQAATHRKNWVGEGEPKYWIQTYEVDVPRIYSLWGQDPDGNWRRLGGGLDIPLKEKP